MSTQVPKIEPRKAADIFEAVRKIAPFYVPEWRMEEQDASYALWKVFAHLLAGVAHRLNKVPDKHLLAYMEQLGISPLPAQPAGAPLTFVLAEGAAESVPVPAGTQAAAGEVVFETERRITLTPAKLTSVYGVDNCADGIYAPPPGFLAGSAGQAFSTVLAYPAEPGHREVFLTDASGLAAGDLLKVGGLEWAAVADLKGATAVLDRGLSFTYEAGAAVVKAVEFELFRGRNEQEHSFYLCQNELFNLKKGTGRGHVLIKLYFTGTAAWSDAGLAKLAGLRWAYWGEDKATAEDQWLSFKVYRVKRSVASTLTAEVWLWKASGRPTKAKEVAGVKSFWIRATALPEQLDVPPLVRVTTALSNLNGPDMAFGNDLPINLKDSFYPFGTTPRPGAALYLASQECFSKKGESLNIEFGLAADSNPMPTEDLDLSWEYWNGKGWQAIKGLSGYLKKGKTKTKTGYKFQGDGGVSFACPPDFNQVEVQGQKNHWLRVRISSGGYGTEDVIAIKEKIYRSLTQIRPPIIKTVKMKLKAAYRRDLHHALTQSELVFTPVTTAIKGEGGPLKLFARPDEPHPALYLGFDRALGKGPVSVFFAACEMVWESAKVPRLVWEYFRANAEQGEWVRLDVVDGTRGMTRSGAVEFVPPADMAVLSKFGRRLYYLRALDVDNKLGLMPRKDDGGSNGPKQKELAVPVLKGIYLNTTWVTQLETVGDESISSNTGQATHRTGGGSRGNVGAGEITSLRTALAFVDRVDNPQPAGGGADLESLARVLARGPGVLKHRNRAVTLEDYEKLALEASLSVVRARCLPNINPQWQTVPGWVTVLIVPAGRKDQPELTPQLKKRVEDYLKTRMPCMVLAAGRLKVCGPLYVEITVRAKIITRHMEAVADLENLAFKSVNEFLHPLTGGDGGKGWPLGAAPCAGDFFKLFEGLAGLDYVEALSLLVKAGSSPEVEVDAVKTVAPELPPYALVCSSGRHQLQIEFRGGS